MKVVLIGDVGGSDGYHLGDEAMLDVAIEELRCRGATELTVISSDSADTSMRYGVPALDRIGFPGRAVRNDRLRDERLAAVVALSDGRSIARSTMFGDGLVQRRAEDVLAAVRAADAVVVAGGGNLSSGWPDQLYERVALMSMAHRCGVASAVTCQTIGPDLSTHHANVLGEALSTSRLVGLRERSSYDRATTLLDRSTPRRLQRDDAVVLPDGDVPPFTGDQLLADGYVALSINPIGAGEESQIHLDALADLVRHMHLRTGLPVAFVPNVGAWSGPASGDVAIGEEIARRVSRDSPLVSVPLLPARSAAALYRRAAAIVSARYHPIVFGLGAAVPCLAITQDHYTATKLTGALGHAGLAGWCIPVEMLASDVVSDAFDELWDRRDELTAHLGTATATWSDLHRAHWDELWESITTAERLAPFRLTSDGIPNPMTPKNAAVTALDVISSRFRERAVATDQSWRETFSTAEEYSHSLERAIETRSVELDALRQRVSDLEADCLERQDESRQSEQAASAARALVGDFGERLDACLAEQAKLTLALVDATTRVEELRRHADRASARAEQLQAQLDEVFATKTFRWTHPLRGVYGRFLRRYRSRPLRRLSR